MKKILIASMILMLTIGYGVLPAFAYTQLQTPVTISATGTISGATETFAVSVVTQGTGAGATLVFETPSGKTSDSGEALKITGGTNEIGNRIIIYTENNLNTGSDKVPTVNASTGIDGGGLVGQNDSNITMAMLWGTDCVANGTVAGPNINVDYAFDGNVDDGVNEVYLVDKRHVATFTGVNSTLDNATMYYANGTAVPNTLSDGLYPQYWDVSLYNSTNVTTRNITSPALFSTIATVAYGCSNKNGTNYDINVPNIATVSTADSINSKIGTTTPIYIYLAVNADGKPAQPYSTGNLKLAIVKD